MTLPAKADYQRFIEPVVRAEPLALLTAEGFSGRALTFTRTVDGIRQEVRFALQVRPTYAKDSAQLILRTHITVPEQVQAIYRDLVPQDPDPSASCTIAAPIESIARERVGMWLFKDPESAAGLEKPITRAISHSVVPYMRETATAAGLFAMIRDDQAAENPAAALLAPDLPPGNRPALGVALALSIGDHPAATTLAEHAYGNAPFRTQYDALFRYMAKA
ncbi:hypothetical protein [Actinocrispum sp. NPDC049592]|uniref:hypothetical protein n=1 Tax=Actinocrispum sp. NPDC049592 TaxID=3154835 RepID=UPI0034251FE9